ncbi:Lon protease 2 [Auxenochlorella protothecoides]|uniref:Lon protease homolog n=1 Tax=Auxenochlorella protothecoides TaxID=3075 RepID=A0A087SI55_AUXPR|nr:Lon protease 2 [Auxenochlorella protothecoides]KFM25409.1 Lon protease 2 [Auxenochlorella protothecoides]
MLTVAVQGNSHLIKHLVHEQGRDVMVAAVPYSPDNGEDHGPADSEGDQPLDHDRLFHTGTAAKVVQLHKSAKSGVWTLSLEGQSRVRVGDVTTADPAHGPYFARVAQLDHFGGAPLANEDSAEEEALARSLLTQARRLSAKRLARGADHSPAYAMGLTYLETLADLPWDRCGLDSVKARIVQYVAVQRLRGWDARAPVLCLVGPPGVGKTSLAASVAACLRRPLHRISLGGVRDEAEVRGHRRTYVGAMPGRVLQGLRRAGARDAVLLLDEVDKMGRDSRGDPAAALLEVLDPEQNAAFVDTYLGLPFDLSAVLFLATANRAADIPEPLLDRMEVIHLPGYTLEEKARRHWRGWKDQGAGRGMAIAERHLVPRVLADHGMTHADLAFPADSLRLLVEGYTREAGVRSLARAIAAVCRHVAVDLVATGEARSSDGGIPGPAGAGSHRDAPASPVACWDVHVHLPAGAVPKDGPSAGVTLAVALVSLFAGRTVRADVAMTGELTLRGLVLPVGGVKEKLLAAHAAGVRRALVPVRNLRDVRDDLPASVREDMQVLGCQRMEEVLAAAFDPPLRLRHTPARL